MPRLLPVLFAVAAGTAHAQSVMVMSVARDQVELVVNGTAVRQLRAGQTSPEGVRLIAADRGAAVLEVEGKRITLGLGQTNTATAVLSADPLGHFRAPVLINGGRTVALIDTGASYVAMSSEEARRLSIDFKRGPRLQIQTANGQINAYRVNLASVRLGDITLYNVDGVVAEGSDEATGMPVLGMSFLNAVEMRRVGNSLTLTQRR